ncbi:hypothetical protein IMCC14465_12040 [alpha proteobacterium IMCC14465]|uniref:Transglycosylase SLT domain-containing protein n=1 Tax=alpha proteobacterium IMCC14465 TaxID=1220535 RepID=J9DH20_9PROT|nr:hypothetical protein IMCC14465_12040 [alpha proteobacterium IMCC14465]
MRLFSCLILLSVLLLSSGEQVAARTLGPPEPRPAYQPPPKLPDHEIYKRIFELQESAKWAAADRLIRELDDTSLLGHVYRLRYMHPTAYRSNWTELRDWLKKYADHPGAWQVYHLAKKRRPTGARMPKPPPARIYNQTYVSSLPVVRTFYKRSTRRIRREVNRLTYRERPTQALRYISKKSVDRQLSAAETDLLRSKIARSYFIEGKPSKALEIAQLATRSRHVVTLSDWHAGLAAWRLNKFNVAVTHFTYLSENENAKNRHRAAASVWAARSYLALNKNPEATSMLENAVRYGGNDFYGLLAYRRLNGPVAFSWTQTSLQETETIENLDAVQRAIKLLEANQQELTELELLNIRNRLTPPQQRALLRLALDLKLSAVELAMTEILEYGNERTPHVLPEGYYPIHDYMPSADYKVDKALIFALIRQESRFKARAKSHAGARGLMQIMPATAAFVSGDRKFRYKSGRDRLYNIPVNLDIGQTYLDKLLGEETMENNLIKALASYNAGPGNVKRWAREIGRAQDPLLFLESMRAPETRLYVQKVMANLWIYRDRLNQSSPSLDELAAGEWPIYRSQTDMQVETTRSKTGSVKVTADVLN